MLHIKLSIVNVNSNLNQNRTVTFNSFLNLSTVSLLNSASFASKMHSTNTSNAFKTTFLAEDPSFNSQTTHTDEINLSDCIDQEVLDEFSLKIGSRIQYYKEENAKFEMIFNRLKLGGHEAMNWDTKNMLEELSDIQEHFGTTELCAASMCMSYINSLGEEDIYLTRLKSTTKLYMEINEKLFKEISVLSSELEVSKKNLDTVFDLSDEELYVLEKKVASYESELAKFEKKHPWLKNPQLDLIYISKEAQVLVNLQEEKETLEKDINIYQGLKPDLQEAARQLATVKKHYEELKQKFHSSA